ncbi:MAG: tetratricopeptide repeat protein [Bryobacteraceae bacterium]
MTETQQTLDGSPDAVATALGRLLQSRAFRRSERLSRFLSFVVQEFLRGRASDLKEFTIGVEVFDKPQSFDSRTDPIVRVEARRLRKKLLQFYSTEGRHETLRFDMPIGGYSPVIRDTRLAPAEPIVLGTARPFGAGLAVLPFVNLTGDGDNDYFSDGLTEELIVALTKLDGLRVVAWNSASRLRGLDLAEAGRRLGVPTALTGSVRRSGDCLRITAQLVSTEDGRFLWSENFDRDATQIFAVQEEIASAMSQTLRVRLTPQSPRRPTNSLEAYHLFLKGRFFWNKRLKDDLRKAIALFEQSIALDPNYAEAHAGLADSWIVLAKLGVEDPSRAMPYARDIALRALTVDASIADAHVSLGSVEAIYWWNWPAAERHFQEALALRPKYATAHHWYAYDYLAPMGRLEEATRELERALEADPLSVVIHSSSAFVSWLCGRYDDSIAMFRKAIDLDSGFQRAHLGIARSLQSAGRFEEACAELDSATVAVGDMPELEALRAHAATLRGHVQEGRKRALQLEKLAEVRPIMPYVLGRAWLDLDNDKMFAYLERAVALRDPRMVHLGVAPIYRGVRGDPRYTRLLRAIGIPAGA